MDREIIANIKTLGIDMINEAKSGHPGIVLGAAPIMYTLFSKHLNISSKDLSWENRDRFVLSAGHGSALLYATLFMAGYLTLDDLKNFRKAGSRTPGHPEYKVTPLVEVSTGPLGQGFATAVGMALGEKILEEKTLFPRKNMLEAKHSLIDHNIYVLCGDGDLMEGVTSEAASFAGNLKLSNLIVLYDSNGVSLDGKTDITFTENVLEKFKALGWHTDIVRNGDDVNAISRAINSAKKVMAPSIIEIKTTIGSGSVNAGTNRVHGGTLSDEDVNQLRLKLGVPSEPFFVNENAKKYFINEINNHTSEKYSRWAYDYRSFFDDNITGNAEEVKFILAKEQNFDVTKFVYGDFADGKNATRVLNGEVIKVLSDNIVNFIGGSADLGSTTKTFLGNNLNTDLSVNNYSGKNIWFGVREHAMGAILNGLSLYNFKVYGSTFLAFSDYMKPAIRMSALMGLPVNYIFTHDAVNIGEDGPTHQPVEQLVSLRATPNLNVFRPCDINEIIGCWNVMLNSKTTPNALILSRVETETIPNSSVTEVSKGAYIIKPETEKMEGIIIATGSEVATAIHIADDLYKQHKISLRVVSMPCQELFLMQSREYQESILPTGYKKVVIEASSSYSWYRFVYNEKYLFTIDNFGISASKDDVLKHLHYTYHEIEEKIYNLFR